MLDSERVHVFEHSQGDWWAECLICREWVSTSNRTQRDAEQKFGRHLQYEHTASTEPVPKLPIGCRRAKTGSLSNEALAAWQRDGYTGDLPDRETAEQRSARSRAATLSLIGLSVEDRGVVDGEDVVVELDAWFIGHALAAADDDGLLRDVSPSGNHA